MLKTCIHSEFFNLLSFCLLLLKQNEMKYAMNAYIELYTYIMQKIQLKNFIRHLIQLIISAFRSISSFRVSPNILISMRAQLPKQVSTFFLNIAVVRLRSFKFKCILYL